MENHVELTMVNGQVHTVVLKGGNNDDIESKYDCLMEKDGFQTVETASGRVISINKDYIVSIEILN